MGWSLSPLSFTQTITPFVMEMRAMGYRVLGYIDYFLLAPEPMWVAVTANDCVKVRKKVLRLMQHLGIKRYMIKGECEGSTHAQHL